MRYTSLFILCLTGLIVSCRRDESPPPHVGTWKLERVVSMKDAGQWTQRFYLVFTKDGHLGGVRSNTQNENDYTPTDNQHWNSRHCFSHHGLQRRSSESARQRGCA